LDTKPESPENKMITFSIPQHVDFAKIERTTQKKTVVIQSNPTDIELCYSRFNVSKIGIILCIRCSLT
jgi:hypothetical protein